MSKAAVVTEMEGIKVMSGTNGLRQAEPVMKLQRTIMENLIDR